MGSLPRFPRFSLTSKSPRFAFFCQVQSSEVSKGRLWNLLELALALFFCSLNLCKWFYCHLIDTQIGKLSRCEAPKLAFCHYLGVLQFLHESCRFCREAWGGWTYVYYQKKTKTIFRNKFQCFHAFLGLFFGKTMFVLESVELSRWTSEFLMIQEKTKKSK